MIVYELRKVVRSSLVVDVVVDFKMDPIPMMIRERFNEYVNTE